MTKIELALIMKTIDAHTTTYVPNYYPDNVRREINDVDKLKADIIRQYNEVMKDADN